MQKKRKIILDTETTGLSIKEGHRIIEIGCVEVIDLQVTGRTFHSYINPENQPISKEAERVHGITLEKLEGEPIFKEIADQFCEFIKDDCIVAHNAMFDVRFLNYELKRAKKRKLIQEEQIIDTLKIARRMFPGSPASLDALCKRFKISLEQRKLHGALLDAQLLSRIYLALNSGLQSKLNFDENSNINQQQQEKAVVNSRKFKNSKEEIAKHKKFLEKINNPAWLH